MVGETREPLATHHVAGPWSPFASATTLQSFARAYPRVETTTICVEHGQFRKHLHHARYTDGFLPHTSRTLPRLPYRVVSLVPLTTVCQTFSLKVTRHHIDGSTSLTKSVPCGLSGLEICIVEVSGAYTCGHEASQARG